MPVLPRTIGSNIQPQQPVFSFGQWIKSAVNFVIVLTVGPLFRFSRIAVTTIIILVATYLAEIIKIFSNVYLLMQSFILISFIHPKINPYIYMDWFDECRTLSHTARAECLRDNLWNQIRYNLNRKLFENPFLVPTVSRNQPDFVPHGNLCRT